MDSTQPAANEFEVSVFGPGVGECVVVHLGCGEWVVVDSYRMPDRTPIALAYLRSLKIDLQSVRLVVATHFDSDHIRGLGDVLAACPKADFVCSAALGLEEFFALVEANRTADEEDSPTSELDEILQLIDARGKLHSRVTTPKYGLEGTLLFARAGHPEANCEVWALSPSSATFTASRLRLAAQIAAPSTLKIPGYARSNNDLSLVTWVRVGNVCALLGGDLETPTAPDEGWNGVVASDVRPHSRATIFKVPHHGSPNGHCESVWTTMLAEPSIALVTPYTRSVPRRPALSDLKRLCEKSSAVHVSSRGILRPPSTRSSSIERAASTKARSRRVLGSEFGQVRVRVSIVDSGLVSVQQFGSAYNGCGVP